MTGRFVIGKNLQNLSRIKKTSLLFKLIIILTSKNLIFLWTRNCLINGLSIFYKDDDDMKNYLNTDREYDDHGEKRLTNIHFASENLCVALTYRSPNFSFISKLYEFLNNKLSGREYCSFNKFKFFLSDKSNFDKEFVRKFFCNYYEYSNKNNFSIITKTKHYLESTYDANIGDQTN